MMIPETSWDQAYINVNLPNKKSKENKQTAQKEKTPQIKNIYAYNRMSNEQHSLANKSWPVFAVRWESTSVVAAIEFY